MNFPRRVLICTCSHHKSGHWHTKTMPDGPCLHCACEHFTPEKVCVCGHGEKAHAKGPCHEADGCKIFRPTPEKGGTLLRGSPKQVHKT